jgi:hypothetical protein
LKAFEKLAFEADIPLSERLWVQILSQQIGELDPDVVIWRYLPFSRFTQLVQFRALWFSRLAAFVDLEEGLTPAIPRAELQAQHRLMEDWFPDEERKRQIRRAHDDNERYGREMIVATCWYVEEHESERMWVLYGKDHEAVAIKSTVRELAGSLTQSLKAKLWIGKVRYVDMAKHEGMDVYQASQAFQRAFLKGMAYSRENELRIATMNLVAPGCLNPDGSPQTDKQRAGHTDTTDGPGICVMANLQRMIKEVRIAPGETNSHRERVERLVREAGFAIPVLKSTLR